MDRLWAPWRMEFIESARQDKGGPCVFCEIEASKDHKKSLVVHRRKHAYVVLNRYPYNNGHLLVVPERHVAELSDLKSDELLDVMGLLSTSVQVLREKLGADGINCGINLGKAAGAGILHHLHVHVVPRWMGDSNFMPVIADTRAMPEYLEATYDRLLAGFSKGGHA